MTALRLVQVDAFADRPFTGNPAAVMPLGAWLDDATLQAIADENNLSETAFTIPCADGEADYELRWFTPAAEVILCGHATLASGHVLIGDKDRIRFRTRRAGLLEVARDEEGYALSLPAWNPAPQPLPEIVAALGGAPVETLWHPNGYALAVYASAAEIRALSPDFKALAAIRDALAIVTAPGDDSDVISRVFAAAHGIDEDPVTGAAHAVMVPYWAERLGRGSAAMTFFQASRRGGRLTGRHDGDRTILGGRCVTVMEGLMQI